MARIRKERQALKSELGSVKAELIDAQEAAAAERVVSDVHLTELREELVNAKRLLQREKAKQQSSESAMEARLNLNLKLSHSEVCCRSKCRSCSISKPTTRGSRVRSSGSGP